MTSLIWANILILGSIALVAAMVLYLTAKKFAVKTSPLTDEIDNILPQANGILLKPVLQPMLKHSKHYTVRSAVKR